MDISLTESKLLEILTEGLKHVNLNGVSFKNAKVIDLSLDSSSWNHDYTITVENDNRW